MTKNVNQAKDTKFLPSEFMRSRRPHLFSDSEILEQAQLDRATFEYHLETLTNRKQELDFEYFARKLAEKELCPNLVPQTGPTGGGDAKVDSETYPVSSEISNRWYYADTKGREGATDRWAFAFSTKEDWKGKIRADVRSIAETNRGYKVAYFITSRFAKDKQKAAIQDESWKAYGLDVRILDRTWIVEKVFTNHRERLAVETLKLNVPLASVIHKGPRDLSREAELSEIEQQIGDPERYSGLHYQLVEDALQAALLARGLELPRVEVDGRFERACRLATEIGIRPQQLRCAYNRAWTSFWWYDDFSSFNQIYDSVEKLVEPSQTAELELLQNLWQLVYASVRNSHLKQSDARLDERTVTLRQRLEELQRNTTRPSAALFARASLILMDSYMSFGNTADLKKHLHQFRDIFEQSKGLIDFPALKFVKILGELEELLPGESSFDSLFEVVLEIARQRESTTVSGRMLLRRGAQKLRAKQPYEAIRLLGRAQQDLALRESRGEMAAALGLCASAYEEVGLLWASRGSLLLATNQALYSFIEEGTITPQLLLCIRHLIWVELQLGRIPCALEWIEAFLVLSSTAAPDDQYRAELHDEWSNIDGVLATLLLRSDIFDLKDVSFLPGVLEQLHLEGSRMALLYALGHEDRLRSDQIIPAEETKEAVAAFFRDWASQPNLPDLPKRPDYLNRQSIELHSTLLGCEVRVQLPNNATSVYLAEGILAGLEAFLATSLGAPLVPHTRLLQLKIVPRDFMDEPLKFSVLHTPHPLVEISPAKDGVGIVTHPSKFQEKLVELISTITAHLVFLPKEGGLRFLESLVRDERGLGRALLITNVQTLLQNILGSSPKFRISDWQAAAPKGDTFPLLRNEGLEVMPTGPTEKAEARRLRPGVGEPPPELTDVENLSHRDRKIHSLVHVNLWDRAEWTGTGFAMTADLNSRPWLMLLFKNRSAAEEIFAGLQAELGHEDSQERLRVSIITGVDKNNPAHYRAIVSENLTSSEEGGAKQFVIVSRINRMTPDTSRNLDTFVARYDRVKSYLLLPGAVTPTGPVPLGSSLGILKRDLNLRPAWQVGRNDPDGAGIDVDDPIRIPEGETNAPVIELLAWKKEREATRNVSPQSERRTRPFLDQLRTPRRKIGRNDPCPCGSGRKYKKCHGR